MPFIREEGEVCRITAAEATQLLDLGLITQCFGCEEYHHEEYERWDEIRDVLAAYRGYVPQIDTHQRAHT